jgi:ankyrin repeat protein
VAEPFCKTEPPDDAAKAFVNAVKSHDAAELRAILEGNKSLQNQIDEPWFDFDGPAVLTARQDRATLDVLLEFGADINARSQWWAGGFGILDGVDVQTADYLISRGARLDIHSAAALGRVEYIRRFLNEDPKIVHARGGDGQTALHVAASVEIIELMVSNGADLEARDLDHSATAAQYLVDQPELCRRLLDHGASPDIYMACAFGDADLAESVLKDRMDALSDEIDHCPATKKVHVRSAGHIYHWRLRGSRSPLEVAAAFGHGHLHDQLYQRSPARVQFLRACFLGDESEVRRILADHSNMVTTLARIFHQVISICA